MRKPRTHELSVQGFRLVLLGLARRQGLIGLWRWQRQVADEIQEKNPFPLKVEHVQNDGMPLFLPARDTVRNMKDGDVVDERKPSLEQKKSIDESLSMSVSDRLGKECWDAIAPCNSGSDLWDGGTQWRIQEL